MLGFTITTESQAFVVGLVLTVAMAVLIKIVMKIEGRED